MAFVGEMMERAEAAPRHSEQTQPEGSWKQQAVQRQVEEVEEAAWSPREEQ